MEPGGNAASTASNASNPSRRRPWIVEVSWCTVGWRSTRQTALATTLPGAQTRLRSLRARSAIIVFSARSLALASSSSASAASSRPVAPRGRVPFIGSVSTVPSGCTRRNRSGEAPTSAKGPASRYRPNGTGASRERRA